MCGICGITIFDNRNNIDKKLLKKMTDSLVHRGPDEEGFFIEKNIGLGHRRLSIIDLKDGQQPLYNEDGSKVIIFNGEIYNYKELKKDLLTKGHIFRTSSDTEVIIHLFEEYGPQCVNYLRGMFAFTIYDKREKTLFIARDRLGIKPLYYYYDKHQFIFGSEIKAILQNKKINKEVDNTAFFDYLKYLYIPAPKSIFKYIKKLPAGHYLFLKNSKIEISQYWDINFNETYDYSEKQYIEELSNIFEESVKMRMISEVPLGAFLSGGIDSSMVVSSMSKYSMDPVKTNSIGFDFSKYNELPYAKETAQLLNTEHHEYVVNAESADVLDKLAWFYDEPFADSSALPTYYVSKMTRENVTVALSGDGGDENFAGYRRYYFDQLENQIRSFVPAILRRSLIKGMAKVYPKADWLPQVFRAKTLLTNISNTPPEGYYNTMTHFSDKTLKEIINPDLSDTLKHYNPYAVFKSHYDNTNSDDLLSRIQYVDIKTYLVDDILTKVDRASMANSLEVRVPLLDHVLMEFIAKIPSNFKLKSGEGKYIFKKLAETSLPNHVLNRKKMGFSIPISEWFKKDLKNVFEEEVLYNNQSSSYFSKNNLGRMWKEHQSNISDYGYQIWSILLFEKWTKKYL